jgi:DegV family protein with EDD domain
MGRIKIVTDSTMDIPQHVLEQYGVEVVPLSFIIDGQTYLDRIDITPAEFIEKMEAASELPKTSQPAVGTFVDVYNRLGEDGSTVLSIHMTSGMSGTYASACTAATLTSTPVEVFDSTYMSQATGFQVLEAAKMAQEGRTVEEIKARLEEIKKNTRLFVVVDTLDNLVKGGRIGKGKAFIGSLLNIKPIAALEDGVYAPVSKVRSHSQVVKALTKYFQEEVAGKTIKSVGISHAKALEVATKLKESIQQVSGFQDVTVYDTTPVISTHTGAGAIGFSYFAE